MRSDMSKILVGRPRGGGRIRIKRRKPNQRSRCLADDAPRRESMSLSRGTKWLNENLAPLVRYLRSQVGRPWDDVYAEIARHVRPTNTVQQHVLVHLWQLVERDTWQEGNLVLARRYGRVLVMSRPGASVQFYVCPRTGRLRESPMRRKGKHFRKRRQADIRWDGKDVELRKLDGSWYAIRLAPIPAEPLERAAKRDVVFDLALAEVFEDEAAALRLRAMYGRDGIYAADKRRLTKKERSRMAVRGTQRARRSH